MSASAVHGYTPRTTSPTSVPSVTQPYPRDTRLHSGGKCPQRLYACDLSSAPAALLCAVRTKSSIPQVRVGCGDPPKAQRPAFCSSTRASAPSIRPGILNEYSFLSSKPPPPYPVPTGYAVALGYQTVPPAGMSTTCCLCSFASTASTHRCPCALLQPAPLYLMSGMRCP